MKERLGAILIREGLITPDERDQALEAQILSGGRLGTNLVDMKRLTVDQVGQVLSLQHNLPVASYDDLYNTPREVVRQVPKAHCARYKVFPLDVRDKVLHLAMLDPDDLVAQDELTFLLDLRIQPYVVPQLRLLQVLEKRHGFMRERRFLRIPDEGEGTPPPVRMVPRSARISSVVPTVKVPRRAFPPVRTLLNTPVPPVVDGEAPDTPHTHRAARPVLGGAAGRSGTELPPPENTTVEERPAGAEPEAEPRTTVAEQSSPAAPRESSEPELVYLDAVTSKAVGAPAPEDVSVDGSDDFEVVVELPDEEQTQIDDTGEADTQVVTRPERAPDDDESATVVLLEPLSLGGIKEAAEALAGAEDRDAIIDLLVHPFRYQPVLGVLLLVRGEMAVGLSASQTPLSAEEVRGLVLPLATPSLLREAFTRREAVVGKVKEDPLQLVIARYLRWEEPEEVCVAPVRHGERVINLLCIQSSPGTRFPAGFTAEVTALCERAAESYVQLIHRHKRPATDRYKAIAASGDAGGEPDRPRLPSQRFFLTGYLGKDEQVSVWRAIDTKRQKVVAVNVLAPGAMRADEIKRLKKIVQVLSTVNHDRILLPLEAGTCEVDRRPYLVTEYIEGTNLRERLEGKPRPPRIEVAEIVRQVADALDAAHARNVTHGDVRPGNVRFPVRDKLSIKLAGFGLPRGLPAGLPRPGAAHYVAPEGIGGPSHNAPADVFALATMAWEMLGGKPLEGESVLDAPELPPLLPGVPTAALNVLMRGLAHSPERRPTARELAAELFKAIRGDES